MFSFTLPLTSPLVGVGGQRYAPVALHQEMTQFSLGAENLAATGIRSPGHPARNESLYRLSHAGPRNSISLCFVLKYWLSFCVRYEGQ